MAFSLVGFLVVGAKRVLELRKDLETEYGIGEDKKTTTQNIAKDIETLQLSFFSGLEMRQNRICNILALSIFTVV